MHELKLDEQSMRICYSIARDPLRFPLRWRQVAQPWPLAIALSVLQNGSEYPIPLSGVLNVPRTIIMAASLPAAPDRLFEMYLDTATHASITGLPAMIQPRPGGVFRAFDGMLTGTMLHIEPKTVIVQTWRSANWPLTDLDSVLILSFWPAPDGARIELVHVNVPEDDFAGVSQGWEKYYWEPWRAYLTTRNP